MMTLAIFGFCVVSGSMMYTFGVRPVLSRIGVV